MALRELVLELGVDVDKRDLDKAVSSLDKIKTAAIRVGSLFIGTGLVAVGYNKLVELGSEAAEAQNKFAAVFGDAQTEVQKDLEDTSKRTGIATNALLEAASNIGALTKPALGSASAAGRLGAQMAEVAQDIASFNNVSPEEALIALRSGLIGSAEPLQRFGVDVRVAALEQEALRMGIQGSVKDLTEAQRIQIRQSAILRQLGSQGALGDATKTSEGFANATRALTSQLKQLGQTIGKFLLEDAAKTAVRFRDIVASITEWVKANEGLIRQRVNDVLQVINNTIEGIVIGVRFLAQGFQSLSEAIGPVASGLLAVLGTITALVLILGAPIVLLLALAAAIGLVIDDLVVFGKGGESVFGKLIASAKDFISQFVDLDQVMEWADRFVDMVGGLWDRIVVLWTDSLAPFFEDMLQRAADFIEVGAQRAGELFEDLGGRLGTLLKDLLNSSIGRVIIDFLGAKAGAVIGEFIGKLAGQLAGRIAGKGKVGKLISGFLSEKIGAGVGKLGGAVLGGILADRAVLQAREALAGPAPALAASPAAGTSLVNQSPTTFNMEIDASNTGDPQVVVDKVVTAIRAEGERERRQAAESFRVATEAP